VYRGQFALQPPTFAILPRPADQARQIDLEPTPRTSLRRQTVNRRSRIGRPRLLAEQAATAIGDRVDRPPAHAQPGRDLALRKPAIVQQPIDLLYQC
jgi:hypothetical protein